MGLEASLSASTNLRRLSPLLLRVYLAIQRQGSRHHNILIHCRRNMEMTLRMGLKWPFIKHGNRYVALVDGALAAPRRVIECEAIGAAVSSTVGKLILLLEPHMLKWLWSSK